MQKRSCPATLSANGLVVLLVLVVFLFSVFAAGGGSAPGRAEKYRALCPRFNYLGQVLKDNSAAIDLAALKTLFQNRASGINNTGTYGCTIMVLGENPELHISPGRPDEAPFQVLAFSPRASTSSRIKE